MAGTKPGHDGWPIGLRRAAETAAGRIDGYAAGVISISGIYQNRRRRTMSATAKLFMHGRSQAVRLPKEFRFEGTEVRVSKVGDKVILEPAEKKRFDAAAWRAGLEEYRDIPFMEDGRDQGTIVDDDDAAALA
jgi:antitoxin VapB